MKRSATKAEHRNRLVIYALLGTVLAAQLVIINWGRHPVLVGAGVTLAVTLVVLMAPVLAEKRR